MNCCENCFSSRYLKQLIPNNSESKGICDFCGTKDTTLYDPRELFLQFKGLVELYVPISFEKNGNINPPRPLEQQILSDFPSNIFNISDPKIVRSLLTEILRDEIAEFREVLDNPVSLSCQIDPHLRKQADKLKISWDIFAKEIKFENRYHIKNIVDLEKLGNLLKRYRMYYNKGGKFYRARISDKNGYKKEEMGSPTTTIATAGRANPEGISYLYLSNDLVTTLYETRAYLFDYVTIGEFTSNKDIKIINLRQTETFDPMPLAEAEELDDFMTHLPFMSHLEKELSKPIRRNDNELDYYPTQYLSEFIKSIGFDGIEYASSLNPNGYNIAIFDPNLFDCTAICVKEISEIRFKHHTL